MPENVYDSFDFKGLITPQLTSPEKIPGNRSVPRKRPANIHYIKNFPLPMHITNNWGIMYKMKKEKVGASQGK